MAKRKLVWVVSDSEPIPQITGTGRLMRAGKLAEYFVGEDCEVVWWTTAFLHDEKRFICDESQSIELNSKLTVRLLHPVKAYKKHVSVERILYARKMGALLREAINAEIKKPDVIHCSWPAIEQSYECVRYGLKNGIPVIIDIRDFWPDIFTQPFCGMIKCIVKLGVEVLYGYKVRFALRNATQIIGISNDAINLARKWGREIKTVDHPLFLCYQEKQYNECDLMKAFDYWNQLGINKESLIIIYIGSIHLRNAQLNLVIDAARTLRNENVKFVLCGNGPDYKKVVEETRSLENVILPGYKNDVELYALGTIGDIGILPYSNTYDFINSLPNKFGEYLFYKLAVVSTLKGYSRQLIEEYDCGIFFNSSQSLIEAIENLLNDVSLLKRKQKNAGRLYADKLNANKVYRQHCLECLSI